MRREHDGSEIRVAILGEDAALVAELEGALAAAGLARCDPDGADVVVLDEARALADASAGARRVIASPSLRTGAPETPWWQPWFNRTACEAAADARVLGSRRLAEAIAWVAGEDRAARRSGPPRLTCVGSTGLALGAAWPIPSGAAIWLGRGRDVGPHDVLVPSSMVARRHAQLGRDEAGVWLRDLGSTNGTLLVRSGAPARLLCPTTYGRDLASPPWLRREPIDERVRLAVGDELVLPGWARFRLDGDLQG
jgi:hypothetical protein